MENKPRPRTEFNAESRVLRFMPKLYEQDYFKVFRVLMDSLTPVETVVQLGCGDMGFFRLLRRIPSMTKCILVDDDEAMLTVCRDRVHPFAADYLNPRDKPLDVEIYLHDHIIEAQPVILEADALIFINRMQKLESHELDEFPHEIFGKCQPGIVVISLPNLDYWKEFGREPKRNTKVFWTRGQFYDWAHNVCSRYLNYSITFEGTGPAPEGYEHAGTANLIAIFTRLYVEPQHQPKHIENKYNLIYEREFPHQVERPLHELVSEKLLVFIQKEIDSKYKRKTYKNLGGKVYLVIRLSKLLESVEEFDIDTDQVIIILERYLGMIVDNYEVLVVLGPSMNI